MKKPYYSEFFPYCGWKNGWQTDGRRQLRSGTVWRGQMGAVTVCRQPSLSQGQFALRDTWVPETLWSETLWNPVHFGAETLWHKRHFDTKYTLTRETLWCQIHFGAMENPKKIFFPIEINRVKKSIVQSMSPGYIETDASNLQMGLKIWTNFFNKCQVFT